ncbi:MAG: tRNA uridine-5-carboxymethylaminomethyl(34) synthesis GTPase MnmE [Bauldia litoralis]
MSKNAKSLPNSAGGDTIFALSSGRGRAGIAVVRVSGPRARGSIEALTGRPPGPARRAALRRLSDPVSGDVLDQALVLWFPGPESVTGEDVAEYHIHGGPAVQEGLLAALAGLDGLSPAPPGAFTRRAFDNGKLDLTEVEGLADLIEAETAAQRHQALRQLDGGLSALYEGWRTELVRLLAHVEAAIDFAEEDLPEDLIQEVRPGVAALACEIGRHLDDNRRGEILRAGLSVAIVGAPNAGKSSFLNALAKRDVAIVSAAAGTTRDVIEMRLDLAGYPVILADTAGLRDAVAAAALDPVEVEGMRRALMRAEAADLKIVVIDGTGGVQEAARSLIDEATLVVVNKSDAPDFEIPRDLAERGALAASAVRGDGIDVVLDRLGGEASERMAVAEVPAMSRSRHRAALTDCVGALDRAGAQVSAELFAEDLRLAARSLGELVGRVDVEQLLDVIFRDFCIGK